MALKEPSTTVFFGGLDGRVTENVLYELACQVATWSKGISYSWDCADTDTPKQAGPVKSIKLVDKSDEGPSKKSFAFIAYEGLVSRPTKSAVYRMHFTKLENC
jgi:hypothetical protein